MDPKTTTTSSPTIELNSDSVENADNPLHGIADAVAFTINQNEKNAQQAQTAKINEIPGSTSNIANVLSQVFSGRETNLNWQQLTNPLPASDQIASQQPVTTTTTTTTTAEPVVATIHHNTQNAIPTTNKETNSSVLPSSTPEKPHRATDGNNFVDITEYLNMAQSDAAKKLGIPVSTLSKRWKEAVVGRKWPYRTVSRIDKEIMTLLHNIPPGEKVPLRPDVEQTLGKLLRQRQEELRSVVIRL